nr:nuclear transport factor 2 family protein [uncultured Flavobacterium sp.]
MSNKDLVVKFYESAGILSKSYCLSIFHPEISLQWYSSKGLLNLELNDLLALSKELKHNYYSLRVEVQDILEEGDVVMIRYTYFVRTFENPEEELVLAVFFTTWQIKDNLLFKGCQMSQLVD